MVTIFGIAGSPLYYFVKKYVELRSAKRRALENIFNELRDGGDALTKGSHKRVTRKYSGKEYDFVVALLNHDVYDSLIHSGHISYFDSKVQQNIQNVFAKIKDRNSYIKKIIELEDSVSIDKFNYEKISLIASRYCELVVKYEDEIKDVVSRLKK